MSNSNHSIDESSDAMGTVIPLPYVDTILLRLAEAVAGAGSIEAIGRIVRELTHDLWKWDAFFFNARRSGEGSLTNIILVDTVDGQQIEMGKGDRANPVTRPRLLEGKAVLENREPGAQSQMLAFGSSRISASLMFAPVTSNGAILGLISVQSYTYHRFTESDTQLLMAIADGVGPALIRCRIESENAAFVDMGKTLSGARSSDEVARITAQTADDLLHWDAFFLNLYSAHALVSRPLLNIDEVDGERVEVEQITAAPVGSLTRRALKEGPLLVLRDSPPDVSSLNTLGDRNRPSLSLMYTRIEGSFGLLGVISVQSYALNAFDRRDLELLETLAEHCKGALERTEAEEAVRARDIRYRFIMEQASAVPYELEYATNSYRFMGEGIEQLTGYSREEFTPQLLRQIVKIVIPRGPAAGLSENEAKELIGSDKYMDWGADIQVVTRSGQLRWLTDTSVQLPDTAGQPMGSLGMLMDITDRKQVEETLRSSEERYRRAITEAGGVPYEKWYADDTFVFVGEGIESLTGYSQSEFTAELWRNIIEDVTVRGEAAGMTRTEAIQRTRVGEVHQWSADVRIRTRSGETKWVYDSSIQLLDEHGRVSGSLGILQDITERKKWEQSLEESEERYSLAVQGANDGLWDWNLQTDQIYFSERMSSMIGCQMEELGDSPQQWLDRVHPDERTQVNTLLQRHMDGIDAYFESEHRLLHHNGDYIWVLIRGVALRDPSGKPYRMAGSMSDITVRKTAENQLLHGAYHDALTGLPNRPHFVQTVARAIARATRRPEYSFAVLFLDLDRFKVVNDSLGHSLGDQLLVQTARRLEICIRPGDMVARIGGDEFTILLDDLADVSDATRVATRIQHEFAKPFELNGQAIYSSTSIGVALNGPQYASPEELLRDADMAMYRAKDAGKARYEVFDSGMHKRAMERLYLETDLRFALEQTSGFHLLYQPLINLASGTLYGVEALVRWRHPKRGLVPPSEFIPLAEETGFIIQLGWWILERACRQARQWQDEFPDQILTMSVNISVIQMRRPEFVKSVEEIVIRHGLRPGSLIFEITESQLMTDAASLLDKLHKLKELGIRIHVDDFGTGYSSLAYLHRFPIDVLKIDRSFINNMGAGDAASEIVPAVISLGHNMSMSIVAEGVETEEQKLMLKSMQCDIVQGYHFSRPVEAIDITSLISKKKIW